MRYFTLITSWLICFAAFGQECVLDFTLDLPDTLTASCNECLSLEASFPQINASSQYTVQSIPFAGLPYSTTAGTGVVSTIDDTWSASIPLGFSFCFFDNAYSNVVIGSNGIVTFDLADANGFCPYAFTAANPSGNLPNNAIFCPYHDIDPSDCGQVRYQMVGQEPCRKFVVSYNAVCLYNCSSVQTTSQLVLHESSNLIEVFVANKPSCGWNNGNTLIGIQNGAANFGYSPPGRNTGNWSTSNEAWGFIPSGDPIGEISWVSDGEIIGSGASIEVCPDSAQTYYAVLNYDFCTSPLNGDDCAVYNINVSSGTWPGEVSWNLVLGGANVLSGGAPFNQAICLPNGCYTLQMFDSFGDGWNGASFNLSYQGATLGTGNLNSGSSGIANFCINEFIPVDPGDPNPLDGFMVDSIFVDVLFDDIIPGLQMPEIACTYDTLVQLVAETPNGIWDASCVGCINENGVFDVSSAGEGVYEIYYTVEGQCGPVLDVVEIVVEAPPLVTISGPDVLCDYDDPVMFEGNVDGGVWTADCGGCIDVSSGVLSPNGLQSGAYSVYYLAGENCQSDAEFIFTIDETLSAVLSTPSVMCMSDSQVITASTDGGFWTADCGGCINQNGLFNGAISGPGTFEIIYDFDSFCASPSITFIEVVSLVDATISSVPELCESGSSINLSATDLGGVWESDCINCLINNSFDPQLSGPGTFIVTYTITGVCSDEDVTEVIVLEQTDATITLPAELCIDAGTIFAAAPSFGGEWSASCGSCIDASSGEIDLAQAGPGILTVQYIINGLCGSSNTVESELFPCSIEIPNVFTPNNDGVNDYLIFNNLEYFPGSTLAVFNRWGGIVYENPNYNNTWRAEGVEDGTYYYVLELQGVDTYQGSFTIVRE